MGNRVKILLSAVIACVILFSAYSSLSFAGNASNDSGLTPEKIIAEHVKSIGGPSLLSSVKTRAFVGTTDVDFIQGMTGNIKGGNAMMLVDGEKMAIVLQYKTLDYDEEYFSYNGQEVSVGHIAPGIKSPLAAFLFRFNGIMKKGFLGGTLSLNWPLLNMKDNEANLKYYKTTIEGRELYELEWPESVLNNIKIRMYFEPEKFHHVRTEYTIRIRNDVSLEDQSTFLGNMGTVDADTGEAGSSNLFGGGLTPDSVYTLVEKFDNYKKVSGMMLPHKYTLEYSYDGQGAFIGEWVINAVKFTFNKSYDAKIFKAFK